MQHLKDLFGVEMVQNCPGKPEPAALLTRGVSSTRPQHLKLGGIITYTFGLYLPSGLFNTRNDPSYFVVSMRTHTGI